MAAADNQQYELYIVIVTGCQHTHETGGVSKVGADLAIDGDQTLLEDHLGLVVSECILQPVAEEHNNRQALGGLVRPSAGLRGLEREKDECRAQRCRAALT